MKKKKLILSICAGVCAVLAGVVSMVAIINGQNKHKHTLSENKTYHLCNDEIYYTRSCVDGCEVRFNTSLTTQDLFVSVSQDDKIVLDEDIVLTEEINIQSFSGVGLNVNSANLKINLDLNSCQISTNIDENAVMYNSLFMFNANKGSIEFNVKNGKLYSDDLSYIFNFQNNPSVEPNIKVNIEDVDCEVSGEKTTPLFAHNTSHNIVVNANNSKFTSSVRSNADTKQYGVGVFINSDSEFNFSNCEFKGGDAVYVKRGTVNLNGCKLINEGLISEYSQGVETFSPVGACLVADSYTTSSGTSEYNITVEGCYMKANSSVTTLYTIQTVKGEGLDVGINAKSKLKIVSCLFNNNPLYIPQNSTLEWVNGQPNNNGTQIWATGEVDRTILD